MEILSFILSTVSTVVTLLSYIDKSGKVYRVLALVFTGSLTLSLSYTFIGNVSGYVICYIATSQSIVNFYFLKKKGGPSIPATVVYCIIYVVANIFFAHSLIDMLPALASVLFAFSIMHVGDFSYRAFVFGNLILWLIFDIATGAYGPVTTHVILLTFDVIGIIRNDILGRKKKVPEKTKNNNIEDVVKVDE